MRFVALLLALLLPVNTLAGGENVGWERLDDGRVLIEINGVKMALSEDDDYGFSVLGLGANEEEEAKGWALLQQIQSDNRRLPLSVRSVFNKKPSEAMQLMEHLSNGNGGWGFSFLIQPEIGGKKRKVLNGVVRIYHRHVREKVRSKYIPVTSCEVPEESKNRPVVDEKKAEYYHRAYKTVPPVPGAVKHKGDYCMQAEDRAYDKTQKLSFNCRRISGYRCEGWIMSRSGKVTIPYSFRPRFEGYRISKRATQLGLYYAPIAEWEELHEAMRNHFQKIFIEEELY